MRKVGWASAVVLVVLSCVSPIVSQDSPASAVEPAADPATGPATTVPDPGATPMPPAATTFNDVLDHVVQREHLFIAQMRHMHPMVETYL